MKKCSDCFKPMQLVLECNKNGERVYFCVHCNSLKKKKKIVYSNKRLFIKE